MTGIHSVLVERADSTALIRLNRPDVLNAFDAPMRSALRDAIQAAEHDTDVRAVVLTGEGRFFSAGADLKAGTLNATQAKTQLLEEYGPALTAIAEMPKPVIAALDGPAVGIGLAYALICDLRVMAESAYLQAPFSDIGLLPDGGLSWLLPQALGYGRAFELAAESQKLDLSRCRSALNRTSTTSASIRRCGPSMKVGENSTMPNRQRWLRSPKRNGPVWSAVRR